MDSKSRDLYLPEIGTVADVARHLQLSHETVRRLIRDGHLPAEKLAGRWYVSRRALLGVLDGGAPPYRGTPRAARLLTLLPCEPAGGDVATEPEGEQ